MTKNNYHELTRTQLFAHNAMQYETAKVDPYDKNAGTGVMGRVKDVLSKNGHVVNTISIDGPSISLEGEHVKSPPVTILGRSGSQKFAMRPDTESDFDIEQYARSLMVDPMNLVEYSVKPGHNNSLRVLTRRKNFSRCLMKPT